MARSLSDFAAATRPRTGPAPWVVGIPEYEECVAGWLAGISIASIRAWLCDECGYDPQVATINRLNYLTRAHPRSRGDS